MHVLSLTHFAHVALYCNSPNIEIAHCAAPCLSKIFLLGRTRLFQEFVYMA